VQRIGDLLGAVVVIGAACGPDECEQFVPNEPFRASLALGCGDVGWHARLPPWAPAKVVRGGKRVRSPPFGDQPIRRSAEVTGLVRSAPGPAYAPRPDGAAPAAECHFVTEISGGLLPMPRQGSGPSGRKARPEPGFLGASPIATGFILRRAFVAPCALDRAARRLNRKRSADPTLRRLRELG
jgi:hypothetical protein